MNKLPQAIKALTLLFLQFIDVGIFIAQILGEHFGVHGLAGGVRDQLIRGCVQRADLVNVRSQIFPNWPKFAFLDFL
jgi:hypothetical protein